MSIRLYDEAVATKIEKWIPETKEGEKQIQVLRPDETAALFAIKADVSKDKPLTLPLIALSRETSIEILNTNKQVKTFDGVKIGQTEAQTITLNAIPILITYQLDIYTVERAQADEFLREFVFNLINYPKVTINIPYNDQNLPHDSNIRVISTIEDNSDIPQRRFRDQFTRYTIRFTIDDAYLFSAPLKTNKTIEAIDVYLKDNEDLIYEDTFRPKKD